MADPASEGFRSLLAAHVASSGWELHSGSFPAEPDRCITIVDSGGQDPNPKWLLDYPRVQVLVRGSVGEYLATFREIKAVKDIMLGIDSQDVNGDRWVAVNILSDVGYVGKDNNERPIWSVNFQLIIEPQSVVDSNREAL